MSEYKAGCAVIWALENCAACHDDPCDDCTHWL